MRIIFMFVASLLALVPLCASAQTSQRQAGAQTAQQRGAAWRAQASLKRGVNVSSVEEHWLDKKNARTQPRHFKIIRDGGFDFIRMTVFAFRHMDANNRLDPKWLDAVDQAIKSATSAGLSVILDEHDFESCGDDADACEPRLLAAWEQMSLRYRRAPRSVFFELLNEPRNKMTPARWNALVARLVPIVRARNPRRTIVIGPTLSNNFRDLPKLELPENDRNILVTTHTYEPFFFTHQGVPFLPALKNISGVRFQDSDENLIKSQFDIMAAWSRAHDRPILMGEFGAYDQSGTPVEDRAHYVATVRRESEAHGFPWAYWHFNGSWIVWDTATESWVEPIHKALIPEKYPK